jgi:hypothetical protein
MSPQTPIMGILLVCKNNMVIQKNTPYLLVCIIIHHRESSLDVLRQITHSLSLFSSSPAHLLNERINITIHPSSWIKCLLFCCGFINCIINAEWQSYNPYPSYGGVMSCFAKFMLTSRRSHKLQNKTHVVQKHFQGDQTCLQGPKTKKPEL